MSINAGQIFDDKAIRDALAMQEKMFIPSDDRRPILIRFTSGHYKKMKAKWLGDSVWGHYAREDGRKVHINLALVEYIEEVNE